MDSFWGGVIGVLVIALSFYVIRLIGEGLINTLLNPITERVWIPAMMKYSPILG